METIKYKNCQIEIKQDEFAESPQEWGDSDIFVVGWHREFWVEGHFPPEMLIDNEDIKSIKGAYGYLYAVDPENFSDYEELAKKIVDKYHVEGIDAYIHGGIVLSLWGEGYVDRWDTARDVGAVFVSRKLTKRSRDKIQKAKKLARDLLLEWNNYLNGNVWRYTIIDDAGSFIDSCGGYYGDYERAVKDAKEYIDFFVREKERKKQQKVKAYILNKVPLEKRIV